MKLTLSPTNAGRSASKDRDRDDSDEDTIQLLLFTKSDAERITPDEPDAQYIVSKHFPHSRGIQHQSWFLLKIFVVSTCWLVHIIAVSSWRVIKSLCYQSRIRSTGQHRNWFEKTLIGLFATVSSVVCIAVLVAIFSPSYTRLPPHYEVLKRRCLGSNDTGRANIRHERVYIASILYDPGGHIIEGSYGRSILKLIELLGPQNTFLSIYQSDSGISGGEALKKFESKIQCDHLLLAEETLPLNNMEVLLLPDGGLGVKRIAYLAAARNRALEPLRTMAGLPYDKILYLNDVIFDPIDAAQLLFSTNMQLDGRAQYRAACGMDFIDVFKYYDTFATRDAEGYSLGLPFFPWFSGEGNEQSRQDVFQQKDHIHVKSCWGGIVVFDAAPFQQVSKTDMTQGDTLGFRSYPDLGWEASECCLIHADLLQARAVTDPSEPIGGVYLNPYVRVAYSQSTFSLLGAAKRIEKLWFPVHVFANHLIGLPWSNARQTLEPGDLIDQTVWVNQSTLDQNTTRREHWDYRQVPAGAGGYCGTSHRRVLIHRLNRGSPRGRNWESIDWMDLRPYSERKLPSLP